MGERLAIELDESSPPNGWATFRII